MSIMRQLVAIIAIGLVGTAAWFVTHGGEDPSTAPAPNGAAPYGAASAPVVLAPVTSETAATSIRAVGSGRALQAVTLYPEAAGTITEILFTPGDHVEAGSVLVRLDDEDERLAVDLARAELTNAERSLDRFEKLRPSGAASEIELEEARSIATTMRHRLSAAQLDLARRVVRAPFAGVVGLIDLDVGASVTAATPVTTLDDRSSLLVAFELAERHAGRISVGHPVEATTDAFPRERFSGRIDAIDSRINSTTRTLRVQARIDNADDRLRPGMAFAVTLEFPGLSLPTVPELAVQWDNRGSFVWAVEEGTVRRVPATILERRGGFALLDTALEVGVPVVVEGVQRMRDGVRVSPVEPLVSGTGGPVVTGPAT